MQPTDMVDCQGGVMDVCMGERFMTTRAIILGVITVQQALEHSSDVGAAKMAHEAGQRQVL